MLKIIRPLRQEQTEKFYKFEPSYKTWNFPLLQSEQISQGMSLPSLVKYLWASITTKLLGRYKCTSLLGFFFVRGKAKGFITLMPVIKPRLVFVSFNPFQITWQLQTLKIIRPHCHEQSERFYNIFRPDLLESSSTRSSWNCPEFLVARCSRVDVIKIYSSSSLTVG